MDLDHPKIHGGDRPLCHQPRKLTPEVQEAICEAIENGATLEIAAQAAGIAPRTLDEWLHHGRKELQENPDEAFAIRRVVLQVPLANALENFPSCALINLKKLLY